MEIPNPRDRDALSLARAPGEAVAARDVGRASLGRSQGLRRGRPRERGSRGDAPPSELRAVCGRCRNSPALSQCATRRCDCSPLPRRVQSLRRALRPGVCRLVHGWVCQRRCQDGAADACGLRCGSERSQVGAAGGRPRPSLLHQRRWVDRETTPSSGIGTANSAAIRSDSTARASASSETRRAYGRTTASIERSFISSPA
jgi:hypothetical protein